MNIEEQLTYIAQQTLQASREELRRLLALDPEEDTGVQPYSRLDDIQYAHNLLLRAAKYVRKANI